MKLIVNQGRGSQGRRQWGKLTHQLGSFGSVAPQLWTVDVVHFYLFVFARLLGSLPNK